MVIIGAGGLAKEINDLLISNLFKDHIYYFDNIRETEEISFPISDVLRDYNSLEKYFLNDPNFILGLGDVNDRSVLFEKAISLGGKAVSIIHGKTSIGVNVKIDESLTMMPFSSISSGCEIGKAVLIYNNVSITHDVYIGDFTAIAPGVSILGRCTIGRFTQIGGNSVILPDVIVGSNVIIGAGSVVTKDVPDNAIVVGNPAKILKFTNY